MDCCLQTSLLLKFILRLSGGNVQFVVSYEVLEHDGDTFKSEKSQSAHLLLHPLSLFLTFNVSVLLIFCIFLFLLSLFLPCLFL